MQVEDAKRLVEFSKDVEAGGATFSILEELEVERDRNFGRMPNKGRFDRNGRGGGNNRRGNYRGNNGYQGRGGGGDSRRHRAPGRFARWVDVVN